MKWLPYPMVRIAAFFIAGILTSINYPTVISERVLIFSLLFIVLFYFLAVFLRQAAVIKYFTSACGVLFMFLAGILITDLKNESLYPDHLSHVNGKIDVFEAQLVADLEPTENGRKSVARVTSARVNSQWQSMNGKVNLYWGKENSVDNLQFGSIIIVRATPRTIEAPRNPDEFDFKKYLAYKNIFHQCFVRPGSWNMVDPKPDQSVLSFAAQARRWSVSRIDKYIPSPREQAIVSALVLGVTDGIDADLRQAYAANGALHVLAVSGLHVAIIYGVLLFFMRPLQKSPTGKWIIAISGLIVLWAYAFLTGLSPSVLRAVVMFSMVAIAQPIQRQTNIYNTLAASAFILLLYDPFMIMSVGFQLSYLAVWGIVALQRPIYQWILIHNSVGDWIWKVSTVSIAAQLSTFALSMFYFHQFPTYFLLSNLFVIPGSFVILLGGLFMLLVSAWQVVAGWCGLILLSIVWLMDEGLFWIADWPGSLIQPIYISPIQCWILYGILLTTMLLIIKKRLVYASVLLVLALVFTMTEENQADSTFIVYHAPKTRAMGWFDGCRRIVRMDSDRLESNTSFRFHVLPHLNHQAGILEYAPAEWSGENLRIMVWKGRKFIHIIKAPFELPSQIKTDFLIISNDALDNLGMVNFDQVILDSSNTLPYCERIQNEIKALGKACTTVNLTGAYTFKIKHGIG